MSFPAYERYNDSGVEWLGRLPSHWVVRQSRRLFSERKERARDGDRQLTASQKLGIVYQEDFIRSGGSQVMQVITGADILKHVEPNDFVISMRSFEGGLEYSPVSGCISSAYVMLIPGGAIHAPFYKYAFKSRVYIQALQATTNLVRDGQALRYGNFCQVPLALPSLGEQHAIAAFLDRETAKIDALVEAQRRLIELLTERLSNLAMNDVEGDWVRLGTVVDEVIRPVEIGQDEIYTRIGLYNRGRGLFHKDPVVGSEIGDSDFFRIESGDLILSGQFAWEGAVALAGDNEAGKVVSHRYPVLKGREGVMRTETAFAVLTSDLGSHFLRENSRGAAGRNRPLNLRSLLKEKVPLLRQKTQDAIVEAVRARTAATGELARLEELLIEHRAALISAAVTGKIDVRGLVDHAVSAEAT